MFVEFTKTASGRFSLIRIKLSQSGSRTSRLLFPCFRYKPDNDSDNRDYLKKIRLPSHITRVAANARISTINAGNNMQKILQKNFLP